jgi:membrane protease YdiL (CAAX protease family)
VSRSSRPIVVFVAIVYALSASLSLLIGLTGGHQSPLIGLSYLSMLLPSAAVVIVNMAMHEPPRIRWDRFPLRYLPAALLLFPAVLHAVMLPAMAAINGGVPWQDWLTPQTDGLYHAPPSRGWGAVTLPGLAGRIAMNALFGLAAVSMLALFEEIGWRAWLLPRIKERMGGRAAVAITAIVWALWHVPYQLSGIQHIDGVPPLNLALTLPAGTAAAGLILGWLWLRTESIWLVSIAHGSLNAWGQYAFKFTRDSGAPAMDLAVLTAGSLCLMAVGIVLLFRVDRLQPARGR